MSSSNVSTRPNYWMIRTEGGKYFSEFNTSNYIGIAWNDFIDFKYIKEVSLKDFRIKVKEHYGDTEKKPGGAATQMQTFVSVMKKGDIIIIPGYSSQSVSFGRVTSDAYISSKPSIDKCPFRKRRNIFWLGTYSRKKLDPNLFSLLNSHRAITNANPYSSFINRMLFPFYIAGDTAHLTLEVITENPVMLKEILTIMNGLTELSLNYEKITGDKIDFDAIQVRASFNSPGPLELIGPKKAMVWALIGMAFLIGGEYEALSCKINVPGIIPLAKEYFTEQRKLDLQELEIRMKYATENKIKIPSTDDIESSN